MRKLTSKRQVTMPRARPLRNAVSAVMERRP